MSLPILYTDRAEDTLNAVCDFIYNKFGATSENRFLDKAEKTISLIAEHPFMFKASTIDEKVRVGLITKQCSVFYRVTDDAIHILFFWDNRQEPILPAI